MMNPYDPNDALSDKSDEYPADALTTIEESPEEFPIEDLNIELEQIRTGLSQKCEGVFNDDEFVSGEVTSGESNSRFKFKDPNHEIDSEESSREYDDGKEINEILQSYMTDSRTDTALSAAPEDPVVNTEVYIKELAEICYSSSGNATVSGSRGNTNELKENGSNELIHLLTEAKTLFEAPVKPEVSIVEVTTTECPLTSSGMELLKIEAKLRECHLVKSQIFGKPDFRLNSLTLSDKWSKHEGLQEPNVATDNFCELLYKSAIVSNTENVASLREVEQTQELSKETLRAPSSEHLAKPIPVDDYTILTRAVELLECRSSTQSIPNNCRGILGILALQEKLKDLFGNKEELENRLFKCNSDFMEFIDILSDKARIISINNKEVENYIKILNLKVPELEKLTASHTESLEDIKFRFKERNVAKIIELRKQIDFYTLNISKMHRKITKINTENMSIKRQMDNLDMDNINYKTYFGKKVEEVRGNMENLHSLNSELQSQLEVVQNSDLGKNENFKLKVPSLKQEIESISDNIKVVRREKNKYESENTELRKKLKQLILAKVMDKQNPGSA